MNILVMGLGYVGLTAAISLARTHNHVYGYDINKESAGKIAKGIPPFIEGDSLTHCMYCRALRRVLAEYRLEIVDHPPKDVEVVLICVGVHLSEKGKPRYKDLFSALAMVSMTVPRSALIIIESTLPPGTMQRLKSNKIMQGYSLAYCPERLSPSSVLHNFQTMPRVVGIDPSDPPEVEAKVREVYDLFIDAPLHITSYINAEITKCAENAYRDIQIATVNEFARIAEVYGGNAWEICELIETIPGRFLPRPGPGVGGYCLPKDGLLLTHAANSPLIRTARSVNDDMPWYVANEIQRMNPKKVAVFGYTYKPNTSDIRNSVSQAIIDKLIWLQIPYIIHDPLLEIDNKQPDPYNVVSGCNIVLIAVGHDQFRSLDLQKLRESTNETNPILYDCQNFISEIEAEQAGWVYKLLGKGGLTH